MVLYYHTTAYPANIYLFTADNRNIRKRYKMCSKLTTKILDDVVLMFLLLAFCFVFFVFIVNIFHPLLTLNK